MKVVLLALALTATQGFATEAKKEPAKAEVKAEAADAVIEGEIIKVKESKNEIYVKSAKGREEIYLDKDVVIKKGEQVMTLKDLKKGTKVKVTGKKQVEIM